MKSKINTKLYLKKLNSAFSAEVTRNIQKLASTLGLAWKNNKNIFMQLLMELKDIYISSEHIK